MDAFWRAPPFARTLSAAVFVFSAAIHFHILPYAWFFFHWDTIFTFPPEIWRFVTSFLLCGGGLGLILDPYFCRWKKKKNFISTRKGRLLTTVLRPGSVPVSQPA